MSLGLADGLAKGDPDRELEGGADGLAEGDADGERVRLAEGDELGLADGLAKGDANGEMVGLAEGNLFAREINRENNRISIK